MFNHEEIMRIALDLAEKGRGLVEPNPLVGAVVVKENKIVGKGYHEQFGGHHAEVNAIREAGSNCKDATIYVTLEPCSHFGKTPPCVDSIKTAGIKRVYYAVHDPNPVTSEKCVNILKEAGIEVSDGILEDEAKKQNTPFFKLMKEKMPYIIAKWAMSLDGKIATHTGDSRWISTDESRAYVHAIRGKMDAIMVGIGTAIADDPLLTCRVSAERIPKRIIVDNKARLPLDSQLIKTINDASVIVATTQHASHTKVNKLKDAGCDIITVNDVNGTVNLRLLFEELGRRQFTNILVEGGSRIFGTMFDNGLADKAVIFIAPKIIGGKDAKSPVSGKGFANVSDSFQLKDANMSQLANDIVVEGTIEKQ